MRLLRMKKQFRDFDRYVHIENNYGVALLFVEPILLENDVVWLMKSEPTISARSGRYHLAKYVFKKRYTMPGQPTQERFEIALNLTFKDGKLHKVRFPKKFSSVLKPGLVSNSLRSVGEGTVNKDERSVTATVATNQKTLTTLIPTRQDIEYALGAVYTKQQTTSRFTMMYQYTLQPKPNEAKKNSPVVSMWFHFRPEEETLKTARVAFNNMSASINFQ
jgi:hypothetical protein